MTHALADEKGPQKSAIPPIKKLPRWERLNNKNLLLTKQKRHLTLKTVPGTIFDALEQRNGVVEVAGGFVCERRIR